MKDRYHKKANVLGIDVSVMRVDKAVNVSMELMRRKGLPVICFLSAGSSLLCQNDEKVADYVTSCNLVLPGDRHIEMAVHHRQDNGEIPEGIGEFADNYLKRMFSKMNREGRSIYTITEQDTHLESLEQYMDESYHNIEVQGTVMRKETKGEADRIVNEINACIPDVVFVCIPADRQIKFMEKHAAMMNTRLCILIESIQPLIRRETEEIPRWVQSLHLEGIYSWFKKEQKIKNTIVGSVFKKKILNEVSEEVTEKSFKEVLPGNNLDTEGRNDKIFEKEINNDKIEQ
nr:WecB/TagA/CpsF family glycosyltransferase [uncultured Anaerobutyricum sp.]